MKLLLGLLLMMSASANAAVNPENQLGWSIYQKNSGQPGNMFLSPTSLYSTFALVFEGSQGATKEAGQKFLLLPPKEKDVILPAFMTELKKISEKKDFVLENAYSLWRDPTLKDLPMTAKYKTFVDKNYKADILEADFKKPEETAKKINDWVSTKTNKLIPTVVNAQALNGSNNAIINAVYFKASWLDQFKKEFTDKLPFYDKNNKSEKTDFMRQTHRFPYFENSKLQYIELAYEGNQVAMGVILPNKNSSLAELEKSLTPAAIESFANATETVSVDVSLPKFKFDWGSPEDFMKQLEDLGLPLKGDFSPMGFKEFAIRKVIHKATIITDEDGTEAAAVTAVMAEGAGAAMTKPKKFLADRPFLFVIRIKATGTWLFLGRVEKP